MKSLNNLSEETIILARKPKQDESGFEPIDVAPVFRELVTKINQLTDELIKAREEIIGLQKKSKRSDERLLEMEQNLSKHRHLIEEIDENLLDEPERTANNIMY